MDKKEKIQLYRDRFYGRQDVFGRYWSTVTEDGGKKSGYAPRCSNFWKPPCHLKNKTGVGCDSCEHRQYVPVTDESTKDHITGADQPQIQYVLQTDSTIKFGAVDFDLKPGKEDKGYGWEDVKKFVSLLEHWQIPHGIARSTTNGFHVYVFLEDFYPANRFRAIIWEAYDRVGFMEYQRQNLKSIPEIFPKQSYNSPSGLGNGIKTPMIIGSFSKERNGFVTNENVWVGKGLPEAEMIEAQWQHLASIPKATTAQLDALIEAEKIEVYEDGPGAKVGSASSPHAGTTRMGKWQPPMSGSIEKVLEGCAAFRKIRDKCAKGETVSHDEGFALFHMAMRTSDGLKWFTSSVPGWGKTDSDMKQLEHSLKKNYAPWTCRTMQEKGLCSAGTQCFKKKPPVETVEGQTVVRDDLPVDRWPEPSPVRYAFGAGDDFLKKLMVEAADVKEIADKEEKFKVLKNIALRAQVFDEEQQKELKVFIKEQKVARISEVAKVFGQAVDEASTEVKKTIGSQRDVLQVDEVRYRKKSPYGYAVVKEIRTKFKDISICDTDIVIETVKTYIEDDREVEVTFQGVARALGVEKKFEISAERWTDDKELCAFFVALLAQAFNVMKANIPAIRQAAMAFSDKSGINMENWFMTQGWYGSSKSYLMPSVLADKDGVRPNTEKKIDLTRKSHARYLDFCILDEEVFRETLFHIKAELLNAWPRMWTTVALGHSLLPVILGPLGNAFSQKPTLFFEGLTGAGKTALTKVMQCFWGNFEKILTLQSSAKGVIDVGYDFKDALLVVDDYKGLTNEQTNAVKQAIQYSYGDDTSIKMTRNQTQSKAKGVRSVLMMTGEMFLTSEASMVARCILVGTDKQDTSSTQDLYMKCEAMKTKYSGVTARYISWFLNQDKEEIRTQYRETFTKMHSTSSHLQNANRLCYNLSLNHLSYSLFVSFMKHHDIVSHQEAKDLVLEHSEYVDSLLLSMSTRCEEEQNGWVFLRLLRQLIDSGQVSIKGIRRFEHSNRPTIGFAGKNKGHANMYPELTWQAVKGVKDTNCPGDVRSIGRQLKHLGIILDTDNDHRCQKLVRSPDGSRQRVWVFDVTSLGYNEDELEVSEFEPSPEGEQKIDGIL